MFSSTLSRPGRALSITLVLLATLLAAIFVAPGGPAWADALTGSLVAPLPLPAGIFLPSTFTAALGLDGCRTDPIVVLSDGTIIDLTATVHTPASQVQQVAYTLHVPPGSSVSRVFYTGGVLETLQVFPDAAANAYGSDTVATTATSNVSVAASTLVFSHNQLRSGAATGISGQHLLVQINP